MSDQKCSWCINRVPTEHANRVTANGTAFPMCKACEEWMMNKAKPTDWISIGLLVAAAGLFYGLFIMTS